MSTFAAAIPHILEHEVGSQWRTGGLTDDPDDPGGPTKWGISLRFARAELARDSDGDGWLDGDIDHDGDVDADDIRQLPRDFAEEAYRRCWWDRYCYGVIEDQDVATKVFDIAVNMGARVVFKDGTIAGAHVLLQRALNALGLRVSEDGHLGPRTIAAVNEADPRRLLVELCAQQTARYREIVAKRPRSAKYLNGWMARARWPLGDPHSSTRSIA